jgi:UTP--glucose-1-phosphate uridylyltransferase
LPIRKVVIPVAGLGTRLLPTTKALPKEMLPVGRIPVIQHVVEEMVGAGLTKLLFVTSRSKTIIENQFDNNTALIRHLDESGRLDDLGDFDYRKRDIEFFYSRQQADPGSTAPGGTGEAILTGESFVGDEPFVVAYGDTIIHSNGRSSFIERMIQAHETSDALVTIGVRPVPDNITHLYGIVQPSEGEVTDTDAFRISDIIEKPPQGEAPTNLAVSARYVFSPRIFDCIRADAEAEAEEGITGAIRALIRDGHPVQCVSLNDDETRYDIGNHESYYKAFIDYALDDPECGDAIRTYIAQKGNVS